MNLEQKRIEISTDRGQTFVALQKFVKDGSSDGVESDEFKFFRAQLDLYGKLCLGRNEDAIAALGKKLSFEECFFCAMDPSLPPSLQAEYGCGNSSFLLILLITSCASLVF
jgi:inositol 1,4,5-triphosphate receptor type 1